jgi:hypothetical protein
MNMDMHKHALPLPAAAFSSQQKAVLPKHQSQHAGCSKVYSKMHLQPNNHAKSCATIQEMRP